MATITYTSNDTWVCPANVSIVTVEAWGAGGGGETGDVSNGGSGGGGGAYVKGDVSVTPTTGYSIVIGIGGNPTFDGGYSSFKDVSTIKAMGGGGAIDGGIGGVGGDSMSCVGPPGAFLDRGGNGANKDSINAVYAGGGGSSAGAGGGYYGTDATDFNGATAPAGGGDGGDGGYAPENGYAPGGGGGGSDGGSPNSAGIGANGQIILTWFEDPSLPPVINSSLAVSANEGESFTYTITATNTPTSFNATGLPTGLSINTSTGVISGVPYTSGVVNVTITATNGDGTDTETLVITFTAMSVNNPVKNTCTPSNTYGGFNHTLFLGCSVISFSTSLGWNEQVSECTIQVAEDTCNAPSSKPKHYYDSELGHHTTTAPDPGFLGETIDIVGCPAYFRVNDFEFSGIIQSWTSSNNAGGNPTYQIKLVSPQQILEGTQLIINEYAGGVGNTPNLFNCFGYMESFGSECPQTYLESLPPIPDNYSLGDEDPDGAIFGTPAGGFGGALVNENGMQWNRIASAFNMLANAIPVQANVWNGGTNGGRVYYKGTTSTAGYGLLPTTHPDGFSSYYVDISELPSVPTYWRMNGLSVGLLDCIKSVCEESGYDFYIELCYVQDGVLDTAGVAKFIKIRTVSRAAQPGSFGAIQDFASAGSIQSTYGQELRNEVMSSFVVGGNRETIYQIEQDNDPENDGQPANAPADDIILPFFGFDADGNMIVPEKDVNDYWIFDLDTFSINERLKVLALPATVEIHELELLFCLGGYDSWLSYEAESADAGQPTDIGTVINAADIAGPFGGRQLIAALVANQQPAPRDFIKAIAKAFPGAKGVEGQIAEDIQAIYDWLNNVATTYYGKQFAVRVPYTCAYEDNESGTIIHSELPNQDGWTEHNSIIGLLRNSVPMEKFKNDSYKYETMVRFDDSNTLAFNKLDQNNIYVDDVNNKMWSKAEVEQGYVYHDFATLFIPRVVVKLDTPVNYIENDAENPQAARLLIELMVRVHGRPRAEVEDAIDKVGAQELFGVLPYIPVMPNAAAFGLKSNITTYGPWYNPGPAGQVVVQRDEGLVPWEYGDVTTMSQAGQSIADAQITNMQVGEVGSVEIPGYPDVPLGAELGAVAGGFFGAGTNLVENRTASTGSFSGTHVVDGPVTINYGYFDYGGSWTGLYGPNVTNISVNVGPEGLTTNYELRTFTPKFGRFAKYNAERLKQIGQQRMKGQKQLKAIFAQQVRRNIVAGQARARDRERAGRIFDPGTPHECFVGQIYDFNGRKRTLVADESLFNTTVEVKADFDKKAIMSLDGLIRPISMDGDGGLPRYFQPAKSNCQHITTVGTQHGIIKGDGDCGLVGDTTQYYSGKRTIEEIDIDYLNPFSNPSGYNRSKVVTDKSNDMNVGHDIDMIARGTGLPDSGGLVMPIAGYDNVAKADYNNDYRPFALRGPLMVQGWGYTTDGRPVPNELDEELDASGGNFVDSGTNNFLDGWLSKPHTWPVAPVDLRLDMERGVWTTPPAPRPLTVRLCENLCGGSALAEVLNGKPAYDDDGILIDNPMIYVFGEDTDIFVASGDKVVALYDSYSCKYYPVNIGEKGIFPFQLQDCMPFNGPGVAKRLRNEDNTYVSYGSSFAIYPGIPNAFGPAPAGYTGWAKMVSNEVGSGCTSEPIATIVAMDRIAEYIEYTTLEDFSAQFGRPAVAEANATYYWNGSDPTYATIYVSLGAHMTKKECFPMGTKGIAVFDPLFTDEVCDPLMYNSIDINQIPRITHKICNNAAGAVTDYEAREFIFDTGLDVEVVSSCKLKIFSKLKAAVSENCVAYADRLTEDTRFERLVFGKGLIAKAITGCGVEVSAGVSVDKTADCIVDGTPTANNVYSTLKFGAGLNVNEVDDCTIEIGIGLRVNDFQTSSMTFSDCFDVTETECGVNIDFKTTGEAATGVEYVHSVSCVDGSIVTTTKFLQFSSCGLFLGVSG